MRVNTFEGVDISQGLQKRDGLSLDDAWNYTSMLLFNPIFGNICTMC